MLGEKHLTKTFISVTNTESVLRKIMKKQVRVHQNPLKQGVQDNQNYLCLTQICPYHFCAIEHCIQAWDLMKVKSFRTWGWVGGGGGIWGHACKFWQSDYNPSNLRINVDMCPCFKDKKKKIIFSLFSFNVSLQCDWTLCSHHHVLWTDSIAFLAVTHIFHSPKVAVASYQQLGLHSCRLQNYEALPPPSAPPSSLGAPVAESPGLPPLENLGLQAWVTGKASPLGDQMCVRQTLVRRPRTGFSKSCAAIRSLQPEKGQIWCCLYALLAEFHMLFMTVFHIPFLVVFFIPFFFLIFQRVTYLSWWLALM